ncbi:AAA family ATPase [Neisseria sp. Ec49-e6-T10]|uniref:AAA family ATPase n=1 Tax=Neisseria sp. Ec49-e6-T10 TaxID=3140744 RepID=UPI003EC0F59A
MFKFTLAVFCLLLFVIYYIVFYKDSKNQSVGNVSKEIEHAEDSSDHEDADHEIISPNTWAKLPEYRALIEFWLWQVIIPLGGQRHFVGEHGFESDGVAKHLGIFKWQYKRSGYNPISARKYLQNQFEDWQKQHSINEVLKYRPDILNRNVQKWANLLNLSEEECAILSFVLLLHTDGVLDDCCDFLGELNSNQSIQVLSTLLHIPEAKVRIALSSKSALFNTGLVKLDLNDDYRLSNKIDVLSSRFVELMVSEDISPIDMLKEHVLNAPQTNLTIADFEHLGELVPALRHYLANVIKERQVGCNILFYGMAGTGKTEFARVLAQALNLDLFEVSWVDDEGDPANRNERLSALRAAQHIFAKQSALLLFDEIEDVFETAQKDFTLNKAWVNRMMESNQVPTIWITNRVNLLDPAMIRRFDFVVQMYPPTRRQREQILQGFAQDFLSKEDIRKMSEHQNLLPALLERSHKVTHAVKDAFPDKQDQANLFQRLLNNTLQAQGYVDINHLQKGVSTLYNLDWVHTKQNLNAIAQGLAKAKSASICLYGPSGTGKSAYVKWVADQLGLELIYKRASDLLSKYVGESEALIADAFDEARRNKAVLLFDEVDSFLQDRRGATHSWEVSMVNEMLTQMEHFEGIFVATTNLMKNLDQAALRRFDFKIEFLYLKKEQAFALFNAYSQQFHLPIVDDHIKIRLASMHTLTPGDFAVAGKRHKVSPFTSTIELLEFLQEECAVKENGHKGQLGFI